MKAFFHILIVPDDDELYDAARIRDLLGMAESQGHPLETGTYLESMTIRQVDALVHGRTDC